MGYFYIGFDYKNRKNGIFKIGQTINLASRLSNIRHFDNFQCLGYLELPEATKSEMLFIESCVRLDLERIGFTQTQNDHFLYRIEQGKKYEQAAEIAQITLKFAIEACQIKKIPYEIGNKTFKRS